MPTTACLGPRRSAIARCGPAAALVAATLAPAAPGTPRAAEPAPDTLVTYPSTYFDVYATTARDADEAASHVKHAQRGFGRYLGEQTPRVTVVSLPSDSALARHDLSRFRNRSFPLIVWTEPVSQILRAAPAQLAARARAEDPRSLSHDVGRAFLESFADQRRRQLGDAAPAAAAGPRAAGMGLRDHPGLPDWFEAAFGALCEYPQLQQARLRAMRQSLDRRIPFAQLLTMARPKDPARAALFANEAYALIHMIERVEDPAVINRVANHMVRGQPLGEALTNAKTLYSKPEVLETQWVEWMTANVSPGPAAAPRPAGAGGAGRPGAGRPPAP
jgi:hypothetical protein